ncbi:hypothetical protein E5D57_012674 [Metarhizium anisopliae]|nr:hypothetical protein E5D57_012674 [Metarhizium anisopliae]
MTFDCDPSEAIPPMIMAAMDLARAAAERADVKRFVLTPSCAAAASPTPGIWRCVGKELTLGTTRRLLRLGGLRRTPPSEDSPSTYT